MSAERRRPRGRRLLAAGLILSAACLVVVVAIVIGTVPVLIGAAVLALSAGAGSALLVDDELATTRRAWAKDRAEQARSYQQHMGAQLREQAGYVAALTGQVAARSRTLAELGGELRLLQARVGELTARLSGERARNVELRTLVADLRAEAEQVASDDVASDDVALWDGAEAPTIVDLLSWEQTVPRDERKQA